MSSASVDVSSLLHEVTTGNQDALARLMPLIYGELRRLAAHCMSDERADHTLQPTALVHEAYMLLVKQNVEWQNKAHFFAVAAQVMRRVLIDHARANLRKKRGGNQIKLSLDEVYLFSENKPDEFIALDESLKRLAERDPRQGRIVEMRFFAGLELKEIAGLLGISEKTVKRDWQVAKMWLYADLRERDGTSTGEMGKS